MSTPGNAVAEMEKKEAAFEKAVATLREVWGLPPGRDWKKAFEEREAATEIGDLYRAIYFAVCTGAGYSVGGSVRAVEYALLHGVPIVGVKLEADGDRCVKVTMTPKPTGNDEKLKALEAQIAGLKECVLSACEENDRNLLYKNVYCAAFKGGGTALGAQKAVEYVLARGVAPGINVEPAPSGSGLRVILTPRGDEAKKELDARLEESKKRAAHEEFYRDVYARALSGAAGVVHGLSDDVNEAMARSRGGSLPGGIKLEQCGSVSVRVISTPKTDKEQSKALETMLCHANQTIEEHEFFRNIYWTALNGLCGVVYGTSKLVDEALDRSAGGMLPGGIKLGRAGNGVHVILPPRKDAAAEEKLKAAEADLARAKRCNETNSFFRAIYFTALRSGNGVVHGVPSLVDEAMDCERAGEMPGNIKLELVPGGVHVASTQTPDADAEKKISALETRLASMKEAAEEASMFRLIYFRALRSGTTTVSATPNLVDLALTRRDSGDLPGGFQLERVDSTTLRVIAAPTVEAGEFSCTGCKKRMRLYIR